MSRGILNSIFQYAAANRSDEPDGYEKLAIAIVHTAVADYRALRRRLVYANAYDRPLIEGRLCEIQNFFNSDYGDILCFGRAEFIWRCLLKEFGGAK